MTARRLGASRGVWRPAGLVALAGCVGLLVISTAYGKGTIHLHGTVAHDHHSRVNLVVKGKRVLFEATNILQHCSDGTTAHLDSGKVHARLTQGRKFAYHRSVADPQTNFQLFFWVEGRLVSDGRAKGELFLFTDDGADLSTGEDAPSCTTFAARGWKAK